MSVSVCTRLFLSLYLFLSSSVFFCLSISLSICPSACLYLKMYVCISLYIYLQEREWKEIREGEGEREEEVEGTWVGDGLAREREIKRFVCLYLCLVSVPLGDFRQGSYPV